MRRCPVIPISPIPLVAIALTYGVVFVGPVLLHVTHVRVDRSARLSSGRLGPGASRLPMNSPDAPSRRGEKVASAHFAVRGGGRGGRRRAERLALGQEGAG